MSELSSLSRDKYSKSPSKSWILGIFCGLLISAFSALYVVLGTLEIFIIPLFILPILFAGHLTFTTFSQGTPLTFGNFFRFFSLYFSGKFRGSFKFITSILITLLINIGVTMILGVISFNIIGAINPDWNQFINDFYALLESEATINMVYELIDKYPSLFISFVSTSIAPSLCISLLFFFYFISRNSLSIQLTMINPRMPSQVGVMIVNRTVQNNRKKFYKNYFSLNWPLYILFNGGYSLGIFVALYLKMDITLILTFGLIFGFVFITFFLPFYFPNMESLFEKTLDDIRVTQNRMTAEAQELLRNQMNMTRDNSQVIDNKTQENDSDDEDK